MIYLSICIPTYNRGNYLKETLESIVIQPHFVNTNEVEIVISDNCSSDNTEEVANKYVALFPTKIKYSRNSENILDRNFEKVLSLGSGQILKLHNDTLNLDSNKLVEVINIIKECLLNDCTPFFLNGTIKKHNTNILCFNEADFLKTVSYWCSWIACFAIRKKDFDSMDDFSIKSNLQLTQVYVLMQLLRKKNKINVIHNKFFTTIAPTNKEGYSLAKVFISNYFQILKPHFISKNEIIILNQEKEIVLFKNILPGFVFIKKNTNDDKLKYKLYTDNYKKIIKSEFSYFTYLKFRVLYQIKILNF